jgi:hypothetical protein
MITQLKYDKLKLLTLLNGGLFSPGFSPAKHLLTASAKSRLFPSVATSANAMKNLFVSSASKP